MKIIERLTQEEIESICKDSQSYSEAAEKMGYRYCSSAGIRAVREYTQLNNIDVSHFHGQGQNKNNFDYSRFQNGRVVKDPRKALLYIRPYKCEICGNSEQMGDDIPLQVHHKDGNHLNNELDNLQLLCPNCHAQTDNQCGKNLSGKQKVTDEQLRNALQSTTSIRQALIKLNVNCEAKSQYERARRVIDKYNIVQERPPKPSTISSAITKKEKFTCIRCGKPIDVKGKTGMCKACYQATEHKEGVVRPTKEQLEKDIYTMSFLKIGKKYGVCDNTIRKWCKKYGLPSTRIELKGAKAKT